MVEWLAYALAPLVPYILIAAGASLVYAGVYHIGKPPQEYRREDRQR